MLWVGQLLRRQGEALDVASARPVIARLLNTLAATLMRHIYESSPPHHG